MKITDFAIRRLAALVRREDHAGVASLLRLIFAEDYQRLPADELLEQIERFYSQAKVRLNAPIVRRANLVQFRRRQVD